MSLLAIHHGGNRVKDDCIISPDWVGEIEGGFEQSFSWVCLFEITQKIGELLVGRSPYLPYPWRDPCSKYIYFSVRSNRAVRSSVLEDEHNIREV